MADYIFLQFTISLCKSKGFSEKYNSDIKNGIEWPGMINDYKFKNENYVLHAIDPIVMMRVATKFGFTCKKIELWGGQKMMIILVLF